MVTAAVLFADQSEGNLIIQHNWAYPGDFLQVHRKCPLNPQNDRDKLASGIVYERSWITENLESMQKIAEVEHLNHIKACNYKI